MDLYVVYEIAEGYDGYENVATIFFQESNARKELDSLKESWIAGQLDSRFKLWWAEEPLDPYQPNTIIRWRLFDSARTSENNATEYLLEIRVLQTGDEDAERGKTHPTSKTPTPKKQQKTK